MTLLVAIDPGETTGWSFYQDGALVEAGVAVGSPPALPAAVYLELNQNRDCSEAVIEKPQTYPMSPVDANDLITLGILVGEWKEYLHRHGADVELALPRTWKGTVPKDIHHRRVLARLTAEEKTRLPKRPRAKNYDHNMLDAVGLGLWKLGRTTR